MTDYDKIVEIANIPSVPIFLALVIFWYPYMGISKICSAIQKHQEKRKWDAIREERLNPTWKKLRDEERKRDKESGIWEKLREEELKREREKHC